VKEELKERVRKCFEGTPKIIYTTSVLEIVTARMKVGIETTDKIREMLWVPIQGLKTKNKRRPMKHLPASIVKHFKRHDAEVLIAFGYGARETNNGPGKTIAVLDYRDGAFRKGPYRRLPSDPFDAIWAEVFSK